MQTKKGSIVEAGANILSGMIIAFVLTQLLVYLSPHISWLDVNISISSNGMLTIILTVVSVVRTYTWRRYFNNKNLVKHTK